MAEGSGDPVFAKVLCTARRDHPLDPSSITPGVVIRAAGATPDRDHPQQLVARWELELIVNVPSDGYGQGALISASVVSGESPGRGVLELEEYLLKALGMVTDGTRQTLGDALGFTLLGWATDFNAAAVDEQNTVGAGVYNLTTEATVGRYYHPVRWVTATAASSSSVDLAWDNPAVRFDSVEVIVRRAEGDTAPATVDAGTGVSLGSAWAESVTDTGLSAATEYSYAVFVGYDEVNEPATTSARYSIAATATVTTDA